MKSCIRCDNKNIAFSTDVICSCKSYWPFAGDSERGWVGIESINIWNIQLCLNCATANLKEALQKEKKKSADRLKIIPFAIPAGIGFAVITLGLAWMLKRGLDIDVALLSISGLIVGAIACLVGLIGWPVNLWINRKAARKLDIIEKDEYKPNNEDIELLAENEGDQIAKTISLDGTLPESYIRLVPPPPLKVTESPQGIPKRKKRYWEIVSSDEVIEWLRSLSKDFYIPKATLENRRKWFQAAINIKNCLQNTGISDNTLDTLEKSLRSKLQLDKSLLSEKLSTRKSKKTVYHEDSGKLMSSADVPVAKSRLVSSIGIETLGDVFITLIESGTTLPCHHKEVFSTASDNQTEIEIHVLHGSSPRVSANVSLGKFKLTDLRKAPRGVPQIEVTFSVQTNGEFVLVAKDLGDGTDLNVVPV